MLRANNKPVIRKPMRFQYKKDLRNHLGETVDQLRRAEQRLKEAEKKAKAIRELKNEVLAQRMFIRALGKQNLNIQQHYANELGRRIPKDVSKIDRFTQTAEAATIVECGVQTAFPQTTISTQTAVVAEQALEIMPIFSSSENVFQNPPFRRMNDEELGEALKRFPNEVQTKLHLDAMSFATQMLQGKKIPAQLWIMEQLIKHWQNYGKK
uniref:Uncharacterized protein n=1 Tax=Panagrolaimus davidi TaxID=227884 RepID=A0A914QDG8_9BILA